MITVLKEDTPPHLGLPINLPSIWHWISHLDTLLSEGRRWFPEQDHPNSSKNTCVDWAAPLKTAFDVTDLKVWLSGNWLTAEDCSTFQRAGCDGVDQGQRMLTVLCLPLCSYSLKPKTPWAWHVCSASGILSSGWAKWGPHLGARKDFKSHPIQLALFTEVKKEAQCLPKVITTFKES